MSVVINANRPSVWRALTTPSELIRWDDRLLELLESAEGYPSPGQHIRWRYRLGTVRVVMHGLGALPPASPYEGEFVHLREELRKFDVPFFAIPGNHDAFASFGGVLNDAAMVGSHFLEDWVPEPIGTLTHPVGETLAWVARSTPVLIKVGRMFEDPFFDGLVEKFIGFRGV